MKKNRSYRRPLSLLMAVLLCLCGCAAQPRPEQSVSSASVESAVSTDEAPGEASASVGADAALPETETEQTEPTQAEASSASESSTAAASEPQSTPAPPSAQDGIPAGKGEKDGEPREKRPLLKAKQGSVLVFCSDYQHRDGWKDPPETLSGVLDAVYAEQLKPDNILFCGDYTTENGHNNYNADPHQAIEKIKSIVQAHDPDLPIEDLIFEQGNHDELTDDISASGLHEYSDYLVYVLNTEKDYPWRQGRRGLKKEVQQGALKLKKCLDALKEAGETRPIFLAGHVPLHFSGRSSKLQGTGDNLYAAELFEVINQEAEDLNLVYLYGHNHSRGWDSYLGGSCVFRAPGDWLLIPRPGEKERVTSHYSKETIQFTYLNAGYVGYFSSAGGEDTLTCTVCQILDDHLEFSRYAEDGVHILSAEGTPNPAKDDRALIPSEYYGTVLESPYSVRLKTTAGAIRQKAA